MSADIERWPAPNDPIAFESLCLHLFRAVWNDPSAQKNGRSGQPQAGVDIFGTTNSESVGVQCKQRDGLVQSKVSVSELEKEVCAAKTFVPRLKHFILATSGPRDARVQERARELTEEHRLKGEFSITVWSWEDIWDQLYQDARLLHSIAPTFWPRLATQNPGRSSAVDATVKFEPGAGIPVAGRPTLTLIQPLDHKKPSRVWLAETKDSPSKLVLKFGITVRDRHCLEKELTTCRALRAIFGDRPDFQAPTEPKDADGTPYLENTYVMDGDLIAWAEKQGGLSAICMAIRIGIVIDLANLVDEIHSARIFHNDISPDNVLVRGISNDEIRRPLLRLIDFGVAKVWHADRIAELKHGGGGFGHTMDPDNPFSAPGKARSVDPTIRSEADLDAQSDVYSLGVLLFQLVAQDFTASLASDWEDRVPTRGLEEIIRAATHHDRAKRLKTAGELASKLVRLPDRDAQLRKEEAELADLLSKAIGSPDAAPNLSRLKELARAKIADDEIAAQLREQRKRVGQIAFWGVLIFVVGVVLAAIRESSLRFQAERETDRAENNVYLASVIGAGAAIEANEWKKARTLLARSSAKYHNWEWGYWSAQSDQSLHGLQSNPYVLSAWCVSRGVSPIAVGCQGRDISIWDVVQGKLLTRYNRYRYRVTASAISSDGEFIVMTSADRVAELWNWRTNETLVSLRGPFDQAVEASFGSAGAVVLARDDLGKWSTWNLITGAYAVPMRVARDSLAARLSPSGSRVAVMRPSGAVEIFDAESGELIDSLAVPDDCGWATEITFDARDLRVGARYPLGRVCIWDLETAKEALILADDADPTTAMALSHDASKCITGSKSGSVRLWDITSGHELQTLWVCSEPVRSIAWNEKDTEVAISNGEKLTVWKMEPHSIYTMRSPDSVVPDMQFTDDGRYVVSASVDTIRLWETERRPDRFTAPNLCDQVECVTSSIDRRVVAGGCRDGTVSLWGISDAVQPWWSYWQREIPFVIVLDATASRVLVGSAGSVIRLFDVASGSMIWERRGKVMPYAVAFGHDRDHIVSMEYDGAVYVVDVVGGSERRIAHVECGTVVPVRGAFTCDGTRLLACMSAFVMAWDVMDGRYLTKLEDGESMFNHASFSADGALIVAVSGNDAGIWNTESGTLLRKLSGHSRGIISAVFSPDGTRVATASHDRTMRIWDVTTGLEVASLRSDMELGSATFTRDGKRVVGLGRKGSVQIWDSVPRSIRSGVHSASTIDGQ